MNQNYRHNWTNRDYNILFVVCSVYYRREDRLRELQNIFKNNREDGLTMMILKYEFLNGNRVVRPWFRDNIPKKMLIAWEEYKSN